MKEDVRRHADRGDVASCDTTDIHLFGRFRPNVAAGVTFVYLTVNTETCAVLVSMYLIVASGKAAGCRPYEAFV